MTCARQPETAGEELLETTPGSEGAFIHCAPVGADVQCAIPDPESFLNTPDHDAQFPSAFVHGFDFFQRQESNGGFGSSQQANRHTLVSPTSRICPTVDGQIDATAPGTHSLQ
jgi:hypothetical protein